MGQDTDPADDGLSCRHPHAPEVRGTGMDVSVPYGLARNPIAIIEPPVTFMIPVTLAVNEYLESEGKRCGRFPGRVMVCWVPSGLPLLSKNVAVKFAVAVERFPGVRARSRIRSYCRTEPPLLRKVRAAFAAERFLHMAWLCRARRSAPGGPPTENSEAGDRSVA